MPPANVPLRPHDRPFWISLMQLRLASEWSGPDLVHAAQLARTFADIEQHRAALMREGDTITNPKSGATKLNPRHVLLEVLLRRSVTLTRLLQLHSAPRMGTPRARAARAAEALEANRTVQQLDDEDDDLLARPGPKLND